MRAAWSRVDEPNDTTADDRLPDSSCRPAASWVTGLYSPPPEVAVVAKSELCWGTGLTWHVSMLVAATKTWLRADAPRRATLFVAQQLMGDCHHPQLNIHINFNIKGA